MTDPRIRQLVIKTGVVKRLAKEKTVYEKEVNLEKARLEKFRNDGADDHVLRKQEEVIQECEMMLPDSKRRLEKEFEVLQKYLEDEKDLHEADAYVKAAEVLNDAKSVLAA